MKKILLTMAFVLTALGNAWADDVTVGNIDIPQGNSSTLEISFDNSKEYRQLFQFMLELPEGITVVSSSQELSDRFNEKADLSYSEPETRKYQFICEAGTDVTSISGNSGVIVRVKLRADASLAVDDVLTGKLTSIEVTDQNTQKFNPVDKTFQISIINPLDEVILDENASTVPSNSGKQVDVTVNRTIKANQWSTICLPFDMSEAQVKEAFGNDVVIAEFTGANFQGDVEDVTSLQMEFKEVKSTSMHIPYLIKVSKAFTSFQVKNVRIYKKSSNIKKEVELRGQEDIFTATIIGMYKKGTVPDDDIFISDDKFWKSTGNTIKAFRAYFNFEEIVINDESLSRISMSFTDDDLTKIIDVRETEDDGSIYNLSGQKVERPNKKGLYIRGGKKVVIK